MPALSNPTSAPLSAGTGPLMWIYALGERDGGTIKIGHTGRERVIDRKHEVNGLQMTDEDYVLLAAVRSTRSGEDITHQYFEKHRQRRGKYTEYYNAADEVVEWVLWLRQQWFVSFSETDTLADAYEAHPDDWVPKAGRRESYPPADPGELIPKHQQLTGPLAGTAWALMPDQTVSFQDYFTPPPIVARAIQAMGAIDLDAASHWLANRRLREHGVEVGDYYTTSRSAMTHDWRRRVWLNPPYGENDRWFTRALEEMDAGHVEQLCLLSPVYAFTTHIAEEIMRRSAAALVLSPTPKFYNPAYPSGRDPVTGKSKDGTNLPHAVIYWGDRRREFLQAFADFGIPFSVAWADIEVAA